MYKEVKTFYNSELYLPLPTNICVNWSSSFKGNIPVFGMYAMVDY